MAPTIIEQSNEAMRRAAEVKRWRKAVGMTQAELAAASGYSVSAIFLFEQGYTAKGRPLGARAWLRYQLILSALDAKLRKGSANGVSPARQDVAEDPPERLRRDRE